MRTYLTYFFLFIATSTFSQNKGIGEWTEHLPYQRGTSISSSDGILYCGTTTGLFTYDLKDNSISRYSTVNLLNDIRISKLSYNKLEKALLIVYEDFNLDILVNGTVINIPFIRNTSIPNKTVNEIYMKDEFAYISAGFGIIKVNLNKQEITETYQFGAGGQAININSTIATSSRIYGASDDGVYYANINNNLLDFNSWNKISSTNSKKYSRIFEFNQNIYIVEEKGSSDDVFQVHTDLTISKIVPLSSKQFIDVFQNDQFLEYASGNSVVRYDNNFSIINSFTKRIDILKGFLFQDSKYYFIDNFNPLSIHASNGQFEKNVRPSGPFQEDIFDMKASNGVLWAVSGGHDGSYNNQNRFARIYKLEEGRWSNYIEFSEPSLKRVYDVLSVNIDPNDPNKVYFGSWGLGMFEFNNELPFINYKDNNSTLKQRQARPGWIAVGETEFDSEGNLWVVNSYNKQLLSVLKKDGLWSGISFSTITSGDNLDSGDETAAKEIAISPNGIIWVALPFDNHILVYDNNGTIENRSDDKSLILKQGQGSGNIPGIRGITMVFDLQGQLWIGTSDGIAVMFNPDNIFNTSDKDFDRIIIPGENDNEILLGGTEILDIKIDGANRKWIATSSGVYLLSEDGKEQIFHFTTQNSPIYSDNILSLAVDDLNGEVFISTSKGLISYRSDVIKGKEDFSEFKVYPNPVREDYYGPIAISGLLDNSTVKITDINGQLVNEVTSEGGQAIWDGNNFNGERVSTGVYLVFNSAENESKSLKTHIGKILFIN